MHVREKTNACSIYKDMKTLKALKGSGRKFQECPKVHGDWKKKHTFWKECEHKYTQKQRR